MAEAKTGRRGRVSSRTADVAEVAGHYDVSDSAIRGWIKMGCPHDGTAASGYRFDLAEVAAWKHRHLRKPGRRPQEGGAGQTAKERKENALASLYEHRLARERREVIDATEVETEWARHAARIRIAVQQIPSTLLPVALRLGMPAAESAAFQREADEIVADVLRELARDEHAKRDDGDQPVEPAVVTDGEDDADPVGGAIPPLGAG